MRSLWLAACLLVFSSSCLAVEEGSVAALATPTLADKDFNSAALKGHVIIVHFWATWCAACRDEMPVLDDFYVRHRAQGVDVIAVSVDRQHDRGDVMAAMRSYHFPASLVSDARTNDFGTPRALPVTYILDRQGKVRRIITPDKQALTQQALSSAVLPLMGGK